MKKSKSWIIIVILLMVIVMMVSFIAKTTLELENENQIKSEPEFSDNEVKQNEIAEVKVSGYHLVTYKQAANETSFVRNLTVNASNTDEIRFVIGTIDEDAFVKERMHFELACEKGENTFNLIEKRYLIKSGEYLFMDISGQDVLYEQTEDRQISFVQKETELLSGQMKMTSSNYALPFQYSLEKVTAYNVLVLGNEITTENGGKGIGASDEKHDYYSLTKTKLEEKFDYVRINRINAVNWETNNQIGEDRANWLMKNLPASSVRDLDLVIFQLGDNYNKADDLETGMQEMINYLRKYSPNAEMVWVGMWDIDEKRLNDLPGICERLEIEFVNISDLATQTEYQSYMQKNKEENTNELQPDFSKIKSVFYPNDKAMEVISNRILEKIFVANL